MSSGHASSVIFSPFPSPVPECTVPARAVIRCHFGHLNHFCNIIDSVCFSTVVTKNSKNRFSANSVRVICTTAALCIVMSYVKVKPMATLCREAVDSCDLGEYCDGVSEFCPSDAYVADGRDCQTDEVC